LSEELWVEDTRSSPTVGLWK